VKTGCECSSSVGLNRGTSARGLLPARGLDVGVTAADRRARRRGAGLPLSPPPLRSRWKSRRRWALGVTITALSSKKSARSSSSELLPAASPGSSSSELLPAAPCSTNLAMRPRPRPLACPRPRAALVSPAHTSTRANANGSSLGTEAIWAILRSRSLSGPSPFPVDTRLRRADRHTDRLTHLPRAPLTPLTPLAGLERVHLARHGLGRGASPSREVATGATGWGQSNQPATSHLTTRHRQAEITTDRRCAPVTRPACGPLSSPTIEKAVLAVSDLRA
jgi:hypothetical protein